MKREGTNMTQHVKYKNVEVVIAVDETAWVDYPNNSDIVNKIGEREAMADLSQRHLTQKPAYRVHYPKNSLGRLFSDIEAIML